MWRVRQALPDIPIIGIGGIDSGEKALEYLYAGANAVEVGAAALYDPTAPLRVPRARRPVGFKAGTCGEARSGGDLEITIN